MINLYFTEKTFKPNEDNYFIVPINLWIIPPNLKDSVRIVVDFEYEVFAKIARINNRKTHVSLFIDTWSYAGLFDEND